MSLNATNRFGNTFTTGSSSSTLKSISLYLSRVSATGNANLNIYATTETSSTPVLITSSLALATINSSSITDSPAGALYQFNFTGSNAISLAATTRYAFALTTTSGNLSGRTTDTPIPGEYGVWLDGTNTWDFFSASGQVEVETTAVPEPGTLILTGSALLAGAIGVYFTRRHKDQALTPAAV